MAFASAVSMGWHHKMVHALIEIVSSIMRMDSALVVRECINYPTQSARMWIPTVLKCSISVARNVWRSISLVQGGNARKLPLIVWLLALSTDSAPSV